MQDATNQSSSEIAAKRLIKLAAETVRKLDAATSAAKQLEDYFGTEVLALRLKLKKLCVSFLETCPASARRKAEELLWRKVLYEVVAASKLFTKEKPLVAADKYLIENHLNYGTSVLIEHLNSTMKKAGEEHLLLPAVDWIPVLYVDEKSGTESAKVPLETNKELQSSIQRILLWLGDLARYRVDFALNSNAAISKHYYYQAVMVNPYDGLPYNQLGTLLSSSDELLSVFYYMRSLMAPERFAGAEANLQKILERVSANPDAVRRDVVQKFKDLANKLFSKKQFDTSDLGWACESVLETIQSMLNSSEPDKDCFADVLLRMAAVVALCEIHAKSKTLPQSSACMAFIFSLFSHVTSFLLRHLEPFIVVVQQAPQKKDMEKESDEIDDDDELGRARLRRRKLSSGSSSQSSGSDFEFSESESESASDVDEEKVPVDPRQFPTNVQEILGSLSVLCSSMKLHADAIPTAGGSARNIWSNFSQLLNTLRRFHQEMPPDSLTRVLEEDWLFYGVKAFQSEMKKLDFTAAVKQGSDVKFQLRLSRILNFGDFLTTVKETEMQVKNGFYITPQPQDRDAANQEKKEKLMHNMAHLWLKSEVQELERKLDGPPRRSRKSDISLPYVFVVPDAAVLSCQQHLLKQIVKNKKCIVVVPTVVISELDELKKESPTARDSIRWLEDCFRTGDRFVRAQRPSEQTPIPLLTYPKRKDKEQWSLFQIAECCNYLSQQHNNTYRTDRDASTPAVLFLTAGSLSSEGKDQSVVGIFASIGVDVKEAKSLLSNKRKSGGKSRG